MSYNLVSDTIDKNDKELYNIKSHLIDYLYNKIEINDHKYTIIKNFADICDLKTKKYYISSNSCGINSFIIFLKKDNNYYSYIIDRRSISYNRQSLKKSSVRIKEIKLAVDLKIYDGTILDGIIIDNDNNILSSKTNKINNKITFMITDVLILAGKSLLTMDYKKKMHTNSLLFQRIIELNNENNNIEVIISKPYELNQFQTMFKESINNNIKNFNIKGITFYPVNSGNKLIYIFDKQDEKIRNDLLNGIKTVNNIDQQNTKLLDLIDKKRIYKFELLNPECIDDIILNFEVVKTNISDVYKLYSIFHGVINGSDKYVKRKIGSAYIPTYILSIKCKTYFLNKDSIIMTCKFNSYKNKWIPLHEADVQKIDIITNEKKIKIIEQEILSDNDELNEDSDH